MNKEQQNRGVNVFEIIQPKENPKLEQKLSFEDLVKKRQKSEIVVKYFKALANQLNKDQDEIKYKSSSDEE